MAQAFENNFQFESLDEVLEMRFKYAALFHSLISLVYWKLCLLLFTDNIATNLMVVGTQKITKNPFEGGKNQIYYCSFNTFFTRITKKQKGLAECII